MERALRGQAVPRTGLRCIPGRALERLARRKPEFWKPLLN